MALVGLGNSFVMWRIFLKQSKELNSLKNYLYTLLRNRGRSRLRSAFQERTVLRGTNMTLALCHIFSGRIITSIRFYRLGSWSKGGLYTTLVITTVCRLYLKNATETCNWLFTCCLAFCIRLCLHVFRSLYDLSAVVTTSVLGRDDHHAARPGLQILRYSIVTKKFVNYAHRKLRKM